MASSTVPPLCRPTCTCIPRRRSEAKLLPPGALPGLIVSVPTLAPRPATDGASVFNAGHAVVFVVDVNLSPAALAGVQRAVCDAVQALPPSATVGLVTFGSVVHVYELGVRGVASCDVFPGGRVSARTAAAVARHEQLPPVAGGEYVAPAHIAATTLLCALGCVRPATPAGTPAPRALGAAVNVAQLVLSACTARCGRLVVVTSGAPSVGPGALPPLDGATPKWGCRGDAGPVDAAYDYFRARGMTALRAGTAVDVLCVGPHNFGVPALQPLAAVTGGAVVLYPDAAGTLHRDVHHLLHVQPVADVLLAVTLDNPLALVRVVGPVCAREDMGGAAEDWPTGGGGAGVSHHLYMPRTGTDAGVALGLALAGDVGAGVSTVSVTVAATARVDGVPVAAATDTVSLAVVDDVLATGEVDDTLAAVVLLKDVVQTAAVLGTAAGRDMVQSACQLWYHATGGPAGPASGSLGDGVVTCLYHALRGVLLGTLHGNADDVAAARGLFLHADAVAACRLMMPALRRYTPTAGPVDKTPFLLEVPLCTLAQQPHTMLLLDHHTQAFVWVGGEVAGKVFEPSRQALLRVAATEAAGRFPAATCQCVVQGRSMARWVASRLQPAHHDPPSAQVAAFPLLASLPDTALARLRASLLRTDDLSLAQFKAALWSAPPPPS